MLTSPMLTPIDLDDQTWAEEIYDIRANWLLSIELNAEHLFTAQPGPEQTFSVRHLLPQFLRYAF